MRPFLGLGKRQFCHVKGRFFEHAARPLTTPMVLCGVLGFFWPPQTCPRRASISGTCSGLK